MIGCEPLLDHPDRAGDRRELDRRRLVVGHVGGVHDRREPPRGLADRCGVGLDRRTELRGHDELTRSECLAQRVSTGDNLPGRPRGPWRWLPRRSACHASGRVTCARAVAEIVGALGVPHNPSRRCASPRTATAPQSRGGSTARSPSSCTRCVPTRSSSSRPTTTTCSSSSASRSSRSASPSRPPGRATTRCCRSSTSRSTPCSRARSRTRVVGEDFDVGRKPGVRARPHDHGAAGPDDPADGRPARAVCGSAARCTRSPRRGAATRSAARSRRAIEHSPLDAARGGRRQRRVLLRGRRPAHERGLACRRARAGVGAARHASCSRPATSSALVAETTPAQLDGGGQRRAARSSTGSRCSEPSTPRPPVFIEAQRAEGHAFAAWGCREHLRRQQGLPARGARARLRRRRCATRPRSGAARREPPLTEERARAAARRRRGPRSGGWAPTSSCCTSSGASSCSV